MQTITLEEVQKKFESLPENLRWAIMAANVDDKIIDIGREYGLKVEQMGQLSLETNAVLFGYTHPDRFEESLKASLGLPNETITEIVKIINEKILKEIKSTFLSLNEEDRKKKEEHRFSPKKEPEMPTPLSNEKKGPIQKINIPIHETPVPKINEGLPVHEISVLNKAGIEIKDQRNTIITPTIIKELPKTQPNNIPNVVIPPKIEVEEKKEVVAEKETESSISAQKFSGPFQMKATTTVYSMNNAQKGDGKFTPTPPTDSKIKTSKVDPYRLDPNE